MTSPKLIAGIITTLLVGAFVLYFVDVKWPENWSLPEIDWNQQTTEKTTKTSPSKKPSSKSSFVPKAIDTYKGVKVYDNGKVRNTFGRNVTEDGYNLGLKYQCVEFVKRFYYKRYNHKMPDSYGNAKDFFNSAIPDGSMNSARGLKQYKNGGAYPPKAEDLIVFGPTPYNKFGHVAIISKVSGGKVEIIQQNPGPGNPSRESFPLMTDGVTWKIDQKYLLGWLRRP